MKLIFTISLFLLCGISYSQVNNNNAVYIIIQPTDLGIGIRYDRKINEHDGAYISKSSGDYIFPGGYIKNHEKLSLGYIRYFNKHKSFATIGANYNKYGEIYYQQQIKPLTLKPLSVDIGVGVIMNDIINIAFTCDCIKYETAICFGINF